jgi:membrane protein DedA with SNARE-associated domain
MNIALFAAANFAGTFVWCAVLATFGHELGRHFGRINALLGPVSWVVLGLLVMGVPALLWMRKRRRTARDLLKSRP